MDKNDTKQRTRYIGQVAECILYEDAIKATKYVSPSETIKATRRGRKDGRSKHQEMILTVGPPNYAERAFIKIARKSGEPFPIQRIQLKWKKKDK
jgi:hypothetical protein